MTTPAPKPTKVSGWHPTDPDVIVEPGIDDKAAGYSPDQQPPAGWFNSEFDLNSSWQEYLRDVLPFGGFSVGESRVDAAGSLVARIKLATALHAAAVRTNLLEAGPDSLPVGFGLWSHTTDSLEWGSEWVYNAAWNGLAWTRTRTGHPSAILRLGPDGTMKLSVRPSGDADTWTSAYGAGGWSQTVAEWGTGGIAHSVATSLTSAIIGTLVVTGGTTLTDGTITGDIDLSGDLDCDDITADDIDAGGDVDIAGTLDVGGDTVLQHLQCAGHHATGNQVVDGSSEIGGNVTVDGAISAGSGLLTTEVHFVKTAYVGPTSESLFYVNEAANHVTGRRLYRPRAGKLVQVAVHGTTPPSAGNNLKLTVSQNLTPVATRTLDDTENRDHSPILTTVSHAIDDYYTVDVEVTGAGDAQSPVIDIVCTLTFQE